MERTVTTYKDLDKWVRAYVDGAFGLFFLIGNPGQAKSHTLKRLMDEKVAEEKKLKAKAPKPVKAKKGAPPVKPDPLRQKPENHIALPLWVVGGQVSAFKMYQLLYQHMDQPIVCDDVDGIYKERALVQLLKALCQTEDVKTLGWYTYNAQMKKADIPEKFSTTSKVCIIANRWQTLTQHVGSLVSRGILIKFTPPPDEVYRYIIANNIIKDKDILAFTKSHLWMLSNLDIRDLQNAVATKKAKLNWKETLAESMGVRDMLLVEKLEGDSNYPTGEARVHEFMRLTGQSRPKYFDAKAAMAEAKKNRKGNKQTTVQGYMA